MKQMLAQVSLSKKDKYQMAVPKQSIPVELLEGPARDVDGTAVAGKDAPAAMNEAVEEVPLVALRLDLRPLPKGLL